MGKNRSTQKKPVPGSLFQHSPTLGPGTKRNLHNARPVTDCLNHCMAFISKGKGFSPYTIKSAHRGYGDPAECRSSVSLQDHLSDQQQLQATAVHQELTSGASPTIHLQSGEKASGPLHSRANTASPRLGTRCSICSSRIWK
jgi:hypothetical protein